MAFLEEEIARAWKVNRDEPVVVRLHFSISSYLDGREPTVDVLQLSRKENFGLGSQLKKIAEAFIHEHWKTLSNESWTEEVERQEAHCQTRHSCPASDMTIARLVDMGFSIEMAKEALTLENGDIDSALSLLLTNPECFMPKAPMKFKGDTVVKKTEVPAVFDGISPYLPSGKDAKVVPSMEGGFLVQVIKYLLQRIPTLNEFCVICDKPHVFQNGAMLKPSVCSRELCVFGYQQLGVMADATEEIATGAEVVGLLVAMASAAVHSSRKGTIFDPFPTVVHPQNPNEFAFHPQVHSISYVVYCQMYQMLSLLNLEKGLCKGSSCPRCYSIHERVFTGTVEQVKLII
jgi:poly [ADP-ribose] polymerase 6/8